MDSVIKELLRRDGIKLWLAPYTVEGRELGVYPDELLTKYAKEAGKSTLEIEQCLEDLRRNAVSRLEANKRYSELQIATVYASCVDVSDSKESTNRAIGFPTPIQIRLEQSGAELRQLVATEYRLQISECQLVHAARPLDDKASLTAQDVKHGAQIMCLKVAGNGPEQSNETAWRNAAEEVRRSVKKFSRQKAYEMEVTDQNGKPLQLPEAEREALALAIAFHEKGRRALKQQDYGQALLFLLEADKEFELCRSTILTIVDNYAILCLDVVWCYLRLQSVNSLPDAERRLRLADEGFRRSYGKQFERLAKIRQGNLYEKGLIIRLQLLQGILAFYQRDFAKSRQDFDQVFTDIKALQVDDEKVSQLMCMGFTSTEARLCLRIAEGNMEVAVQKIMEQREDEKKNQKQNNETRRAQRIQKKCGKTVSGKEIDIASYDNLTNMGFKASAVADALRKSDNDLNAALDTLQNSQAASSSVQHADDNVAALQQSIIDQVSGLGLCAESVTAALRSHPTDFNAAVDAVLSASGSGFASAELRNGIISMATELQRNLNRNNATSSTSDSEEEVMDPADMIAYSKLRDDVSQSLYDHVDMTLDEELQILEQYSILLTPHIK